MTSDKDLKSRYVIIAVFALLLVYVMICGVIIILRYFVGGLI